MPHLPRLFAFLISFASVFRCSFTLQTSHSLESNVFRTTTVLAMIAHAMGQGAHGAHSLSCAKKPHLHARRFTFAPKCIFRGFPLLATFFFSQCVLGRVPHQLMRTVHTPHRPGLSRSIGKRYSAVFCVWHFKEQLFRPNARKKYTSSFVDI